MFQVWIDQDLCTGDGLCTDHCPEVFVLLDDGISYVRDPATKVVGSDPGGRSSMVGVPAKLEQRVVDAALDCPGECIFIEIGATFDRSLANHSPAEGLPIEPAAVSGALAAGAGDRDHGGDSEHPPALGTPRVGDLHGEPHVGCQ